LHCINSREEASSNEGSYFGCLTTISLMSGANVGSLVKIEGKIRLAEADTSMLIDVNEREMKDTMKGRSASSLSQSKDKRLGREVGAVGKQLRRSL